MVICTQTNNRYLSIYGKTEKTNTMPDLYLLCAQEFILEWFKQRRFRVENVA